MNEALERASIEAVETDLGEFIVQLRNEPPYHIVTPAIMKSSKAWFSKVSVEAYFCFGALSL